MVVQPIDRAHPGVSQHVHLPKLAEVEEQRELPGHGPQRQEGGQYLGQQEEEVDGVNSSFQGQDDNFLIGQEEEQHRQLEHEREDPEGCQLWHLMTGGGCRRKGGQRWSMMCGDAQIEQSAVASMLKHSSVLPDRVVDKVSP